jgi:hypothetical protein
MTHDEVRTIMSVYQMWLTGEKGGVEAESRRISKAEHIKREKVSPRDASGGVYGFQDFEFFQDPSFA